MSICFLDFECYFSKEVTLKKLSIDTYVQHPDFKIHGVSIKIDDGPIKWYSGKATVKALQVCKNEPIVCHNAYFDAYILNYWYKIQPPFIYDTMCMARAIYGPEKSAALKSIAEELGLGHKDTLRLMELEGVRDLSPDQEQVFAEEYAKPDVQMMYDAFQIMRPNFPQSELDLIDLTIRMYTEPTLLLNPDLLEENLTVVQQEKRDSLMAVSWVLDYYPPVQQFIGEYNPYEATRAILASNQQFAELLTKLGITPPMKKSVANGEPTYAFSKKDVGFIKLLEHKDEKIRALVHARLEAKSTIEETRTKTFQKKSHQPFPVQLMYYGAHTGRYSGGSGEKKQGGTNLQNLKRGSKLRYAIEAPPGYVLVASDSSQIEARGVGLVAGQMDLVNDFANGRDIYSLFASDLYGFEVSKKTPVERYVGKTCILGLGYGMGGPKLKWTLETGKPPVQYTEERCQEIVKFYRQKYPEIPKLWYLMQDCLGYILKRDRKDFEYFAVDKQGIQLPNGFYVRYNQLRKNDKEYEYWGRKQGRPQWVKIYGGMMTENLIQALARIVVTDQMNQINKRYRVVLMVHDEVVCLAPEKEADEALTFVEKVMKTPPKWAERWPVSCEAGYGRNYGETK